MRLIPFFLAVIFSAVTIGSGILGAEAFLAWVNELGPVTPFALCFLIFAPIDIIIKSGWRIAAKIASCITAITNKGATPAKVP